MTRNQWEIVTALLRLSNTLEPIIVKHLNTYGVGWTDLRLIIMIRLHGGISQKALAAKTGLSQGVVSNRLDRMEQLRLITRTHVMRRLVAVNLTDFGGELLKLIMNSLEEIPPLTALQGLTVDEDEAIASGLRRLVQVLGHPVDPPALQSSDSELSATVRRLGDELHDLVRAYKILSKGPCSSAEG